MPACLRRLALCCLALSLLFGVGPAPAVLADPVPAPAKVTPPDVPGQVIVAPSRRQRERRALQALLTERNAELAALQARIDAAGPEAQAALQVELEQHKRATRLAVIDRQLESARARGDQALTRRLDVQRMRLAAGVAAPLAPTTAQPSEVAR